MNELKNIRWGLLGLMIVAGMSSSRLMASDETTAVPAKASTATEDLVKILAEETLEKATKEEAEAREDIAEAKEDLVEANEDLAEVLERQDLAKAVLAEKAAEETPAVEAAEETPVEETTKRNPLAKFAVQFANSSMSGLLKVYTTSKSGVGFVVDKSKSGVGFVVDKSKSGFAFVLDIFDFRHSFNDGKSNIFSKMWYSVIDMLRGFFTDASRYIPATSDEMGVSLNRDIETYEGKETLKDAVYGSDDRVLTDEEIKAFELKIIDTPAGPLRKFMLKKLAVILKRKKEREEADSQDVDAQDELEEVPVEPETLSGVVGKDSSETKDTSLAQQVNTPECCPTLNVELEG